MPENTIIGSSSANPTNLFKAVQSGFQRQSPASQPPQQSKKEEIYSVEISQEAIDLQRQEEAKETKIEEKVEAQQQARMETDQKVQTRVAEARKEAEQQSIDIVV